MAAFILGGTLPSAPVPAPPQDNRTAQLGRWAPAIWLAIALFVLGIGAAILYRVGHPGWIWAVIFLGYVYMAKVILTRA
jgi:hypothetical protein